MVKSIPCVATETWSGLVLLLLIQLINGGVKPMLVDFTGVLMEGHGVNIRRIRGLPLRFVDVLPWIWTSGGKGIL